MRKWMSTWMNELWVSQRVEKDKERQKQSPPKHWLPGTQPLTSLISLFNCTEAVLPFSPHKNVLQKPQCGNVNWCCHCGEWYGDILESWIQTYCMTQPFHSMEMNPAHQRVICTPMFMSAQFTIAKIWNHPWCLSTDDRTKKLKYIYMMECYSAIKNEILLQQCACNWISSCLVKKASFKRRNIMFPWFVVIYGVQIKSNV